MGKILKDALGSTLTQTEGEDIAYSAQRTATFAVAASDDLDAGKDAADYLGDGTADDVEIQAPVTVLAGNGGDVALSKGTFTLAAYLQLNNSLVLSGAGSYATLLQRASAATTLYNLIVNENGLPDGSGGAGNSWIVIEKLTCDGTFDGSPSAGNVGAQIDLAFATNCIVRDVRSINAYKHCFEAARSQDVHFERCYGNKSGDDIFSATDYSHPCGTSGVSESTRIYFTNCYATGASNSSYEVDDGPFGIWYIQCHVADKDFNIHCHAGEVTPKRIHYINCTGNNYGGCFTIAGRDDYSDQSENISIINPNITGAINLSSTKNVTVLGGHVRNPWESGYPGSQWEYVGLTLQREVSGVNVLGTRFDNIGYRSISITSNSHTISDVRIQGCGFSTTRREMIWLAAQAGYAVDGLRILDNTFADKPSERGDQVHFDVDEDVTHVNISRNLFLGSSLDENIEIDCNSKDFSGIIEGNVFSGSTNTITHTGTNTGHLDIRNNDGLVSSGDVITIPKTIDHADIIDDGGASGHIDFDDDIPAGSLVKAVNSAPSTAFNSDDTTTLTMMIGYVGDLDAFNLTADPGENMFNHTTDAFWGESDCQAHIVTTAKTPRVTFTEDNDITHIISGGNAQGAVTLAITYMKA